MTAIALKRPPLSNGMLWSGRILMVVWGAFWIWFNVASGISEIPELGVTAFLMHLIMPALILVVILHYSDDMIDRLGLSALPL